jgi:hypothetical protein
MAGVEIGACTRFLKDLTQHIIGTRDTCAADGKYACGGVETIDFIAAKFDLMSYALGNVIKYATRYPHTKNPKDLLKAAHYLGMIYEYHMARERGRNE